MSAGWAIWLLLGFSQWRWTLRRMRYMYREDERLCWADMTVLVPLATLAALMGPLMICYRACKKIAGLADAHDMMVLLSGQTKQEVLRDRERRVQELEAEIVRLDRIIEERSLV